MIRKRLLYILLTFFLIGCTSGCTTTDLVSSTFESSTTEDPIIQGDQVKSSSDAIAYLEKSVANSEPNLYLYVDQNGIEASEVVSAVTRKISYGKKDYKMCNIKGCYITTTTQENVSQIEIELKYYMSPDQTKYVDQRIQSIAPKLRDTDDVQTYKNIYEWICSNVEYDYDTAEGVADRFSAYNALKEGKAVCYGYAALYQRLCDELDLPCIVLTSESPAHAWNVVTIDNRYYHVDSTFGSSAGFTNWNYFLCGQDKIQYSNGYGIKLAPESMVLEIEK